MQGMVVAHPLTDVAADPWEFTLDESLFDVVHPSVISGPRMDNETSGQDANHSASRNIIEPVDMQDTNSALSWLSSSEDRVTNLGTDVGTSPETLTETVNHSDYMEENATSKEWDPVAEFESWLHSGAIDIIPLRSD